jgi:hypothetical protein
VHCQGIAHPAVPIRINSGMSQDLKHDIAHGRAVAEAASFPCQEDEVRQKAKAMGSAARPVGALRAVFREGRP